MRLPVLLLLSLPLAAYDPPVGTAGPLTVRLQRPSIGSYGAGGWVELNQPDTPFTVPVTLENAGPTPLKGALRLRLTDAWRATPADPVPFTLAPRARASFEFRVHFGRPTYNAHYPVHAYADFEQAGQRATAHAVMVLLVRQPDAPRAPLPAVWRPVPVPAQGVVGLWRLPVRRESFSVAPEAVQSGATGRESYEFAAPVQYNGDGVRLLLGPRAPSRRENVTAARVTFPLALPKTGPLTLSATLRGAATFRVLAGGVLLERQVTTKAPQDVSVDLARFAGREIQLTLEAEGSSEAVWLRPAISAGPPAAATPVSAAQTLGEGVTYAPGRRGLLDARIAFTHGGRQLAFDGFRVRVTGDQLEDPQSAAEFLGVEMRKAANAVTGVHRFRNWAGSFAVAVTLTANKGGLDASFKLENAPAPQSWLAVRLEEVGAGAWSEAPARVYAGPGNVIVNPKAFRLNFDGHNLATSFVGFEFPSGCALVQGVDAVPDRLNVDPAARIATLETPHAQTMRFIPAANVWEGVKAWRETAPQPSAGVRNLAGRFVFDLWRGRYAQSAQMLRRAFHYGLTDAVVIWHAWQRWGYDYRLPDIYPPNPEFGTLDEFKALVQLCRSAGVYFAPHDNYIDFYPDAEGFTYDRVVFSALGAPQRAWFHMRRDAQSYRFRPDGLLPLIERNLKLERDGFAPTAYFIDVWSSIAPHDYWTRDGQFFSRQTTRRAWGEAFAWIRDFLGNNAPQISEAGHDQLIGWLDGAQAQQLRVDPQGRGFTWRIEAADAERIPWIDAAYHDRFVLHGAGYPGRYEGGLAAAEHGIYSDDYIATEVLSGRPAMVSEPFSRDVVRKYWLTHALVRALAGQRIEAVEFDAGDIHRQHVRWSNGVEVWVNRGTADWTVAGHTLPPYGFYAAGAGVTAAIERRAEATVETAAAPGDFYEEVRGTGGYRLTRSAETLLTPLPGSKPFTARLDWKKLAGGVEPPRSAEALDEAGAALGTKPVRWEGAIVAVDIDPAVFAYRLR